MYQSGGGAPAWRYSMGTMNSVSSAMDIPPNAGIAMGIMMSAPRPVSVSTGSSARIVVADVISAGRTRRSAPEITARRTGARLARVPPARGPR